MRLNCDQIRADRARMEQFICERITGGVNRIDLGAGAWADLTAVWNDEHGWSLLLETDEPEWVDLWEVCDHFRRKEMAGWEWWQEFDREMAKGKAYDLEKENAVLRQELNTGVHDNDNGISAVDENELPKEVSTAEAARILGVSKDTVLKWKAAGLLEYRNLAPPTSSRGVFRFLLASVMELRKGYQTDFPAPPTPHQPQRRRVRQGKQPQFKHLRLD
jgi:hypothetical protein